MVTGLKLVYNLSIIQRSFLSCLFLIGAIVLVYGKKGGTTDTIYQNIRKASEQRDYGLLAELYHKRGIKDFTIPNFQHRVINDLSQSAKYYKLNKDKVGYFKVRILLAEFYSENEIFKTDAIRIINEAKQFFIKKKDASSLRICYKTLSKVYLLLNDFERALLNINYAIDIEEILISGQYIDLLFDKAHILAQFGYIELAESYWGVIVDADYNYWWPKVGKEKSQYLLLQKQYTESAKTLNEILPKYKNFPQDLADIHRWLAICYENIDSVKLAYTHLKNYQKYYESITNSDRAALSKRLLIEYQTAEKEKTIKRLEEEQMLASERLKRRNYLSITLMIGMIAAIISLFFIWRFYKQKFRANKILSDQREYINRKKIEDLEKEVQINQLKNLVDGQEAERKRVAQELHDSVGGLLSYLKLKFENYKVAGKSMQTNHTLSNEVGELLDQACTEVRDISRNLSPSALENHGLINATKNLLQRYKSHHQIDMDFYSNVEQIVNLPKNVALNIYRIVQELVNNAIKHSNATEVVVQFIQEEEDLIVKIEDNGDGFDPNKVKAGLGLENIKIRSALINAELEIDTREGKGCSNLLILKHKRS